MKTKMTWWTGPALLALLVSSGCGGDTPEPSNSPTATPQAGPTLTPGGGTPGTATPGVTGTPTTMTPETGTPGTGTPGTATPGTGTPGTATPGTETPGTDTPTTGTPGGPTPTATLLPEVTPTIAPTPTATPIPAQDLDNDGFTVAQGDCNDSDKTINPAAVDVPYDGIDQDCADGDLVDVDDDGYPGVTTAPGDLVDCNDNNEAIHPDQVEICDGLDQNCSGTADEGLLITSYLDSDKDGYGGTTSITACTIPQGYDKDSGDCADSDASVNPGAQETCNSKDDDCDTLIDDADPSTTGKITWYRDVDLDSYGDVTTTKAACTKPTGYVSNSADCNDADSNINPTASEICNGKDDDCDNLKDDADPSTINRSTWYVDADVDGYGAANVTTQACSQPSGYVSNSTDCNDSDKFINPGASEICDGKDNNCNGQQDEGVTATPYYQDSDKDGYGSKTVIITTCLQPSGYIPVSGDCDDTNAAIHPGATEICNGKDDDCDSGTDEAGAEESCSGSDTECQSRGCAGGSCVALATPFGTPVLSQTPGDCKVDVCDGSGGVTTSSQDTDIPAAPGQCSQGACSNGVPSTLPLDLGVQCTENGGAACNGAGICLPMFTFVKVGDGAAPLTSAAAPVTLEYRLSDGNLLHSLTMPIAFGANNQQPLTMAGTKTAEGHISLSVDGHKLTLAGYAALPGTPSIATSTAISYNRVVGVVDASRNVNTTTRMDAAFSAESIRTVVSTDGSEFWVAGNSNSTPSTAGIHYTTLGALGSVQILTTPNNIRTLAIANGKLYGDSATASYYGVFMVSNGLSQVPGETGTVLPGMPNVSGPSPYSMAFMDRNPNVSGIDTLYLADDRSTASGGGVQKWQYDPASSAWVLTNTFTTGQTVGVRGMAATVTGSVVTIVGTTTDTTSNKIITFQDDGTNLNPTVSLVMTAPTNTVYRGVAPSPK